LVIVELLAVLYVDTPSIPAFLSNALKILRVLIRRHAAGDLVLVDIALAGEVIPGLDEKMIIHSGPPIDWQRMCGAQRGAIIGQVLYEGWATSVKDAIDLLDKGAVRLKPNHHHHTVEPMAGTISPSAPV
jgi:hypothetical protein